MKALLARYGSCDAAMTGKDGVTAFHKAWASSAPYQLIILDIMLPDMDGLKVLEVIRKMEEAMNVPPEQKAHIFIVSSVDRRDHIMKAHSLGLDAWLAKPIIRKELLEALERVNLAE
jgi:two-component system chemotaxis response regulator CheY